MINSVKRVQTDDEDLNRVQDGLRSAVNQVLVVPTLDGVLVETEPDANGHAIGIVLGATAKNISHKLGRAYRGWQIIDRNADARIWADPAVGAPPVDPNVDHTKFLRLVASATVTVRLWVF